MTHMGIISMHVIPIERVHSVMNLCVDNWGVVFSVYVAGPKEMCSSVKSWCKARKISCRVTKLGTRKLRKVKSESQIEQTNIDHAKLNKRGSISYRKPITPRGYTQCRNVMLASTHLLCFSDANENPMLKQIVREAVERNISCLDALIK